MVLHIGKRQALASAHPSGEMLAAPRGELFEGHRRQGAMALRPTRGSCRAQRPRAARRVPADSDRIMILGYSGPCPSLRIKEYSSSLAPLSHLVAS